MNYSATELIDRIRNIYNSCDPAEQEVLMQILRELADTGTSPTYEQVWLSDYIEIPVDIDTFLNADTYLGKTNRNGEAVYPFWRKSLNEFFGAGNKYWEWILTGATRIGKTSTAISGASYMLYRLMCLKDPNKYFNIKDISKFSILFFNITKDLAKTVSFREFNDTLKESPWFNARGYFSKSETNYIYIPNGGKIVIEYGSDAAHGLGKQVFCAVMDECNFSQAGIKDVKKAKTKMRNTYTTIAARVSGTFKHGGQVFGKIFACSSKRSDSDFMEDYVQDQLDAGAGEHMYISDAPQWEVKPKGTYSSETFTIAVGGRHQKSFVVPDNQVFPEALADLESQGYKLLHPPVDMKTNFLADFNIALRDLAGIAVLGSMSYFTQEMLTKCIKTDRRNPFYSDILQTGVKDNITLEEYFHLDEVLPIFKRVPIYIHLDLSLVSDRTGISGGAIIGRKDITSPDGKKISEPIYAQMFAVAVEAPRDDKISYSKIISFICWLRKSGYNIDRISRDQFQSEYVAQELEAKGFTVDKISLDRTPDGYGALHTVILEERFEMLDSKLLQDELIHLQRDMVTGRTDHPLGGCFTADTKIALVDGRFVSIADLLIEQEYKTNWVYTINEAKHKIEPKPIKRVFQSKITKQLVKVTLDSGEVITCTPNHRFMLRDGLYKEIQDCKVGDALMPLYTKFPNGIMRNYRMYYEPFEGKWHFEHRQFCPNAIHKKGWVVHHQNYNKVDNTPNNLLCVTVADHTRIHNNRTKDYKHLSKVITQWHKSIVNTEAYAKRSESCRKGRYAYLKRLDPNYVPFAEKDAKRIQAIESTFNVDWNTLSIGERDSYAVKYRRMCDPTIQERISAKISENHKQGKYKRVQEVISQKRWVTDGVTSLYINKSDPIPSGFRPGRVIVWSEEAKLRAAERGRNLTTEERAKRACAKGKIWINNGETNRYLAKGEPIPDGFVKGKINRKHNPPIYKNHKIVSIEYICEPCRVYDLEIVDNHNFALAAGVFVHNSKDLSDATAGWVWNAVLHNQGVPVATKSKVNAILAVNGPRSAQSNGLPNLFGNNYRKFGR